MSCSIGRGSRTRIESAIVSSGANLSLRDAPSARRQFSACQQTRHGYPSRHCRRRAGGQCSEQSQRSFQRVSHALARWSQPTNATTVSQSSHQSLVFAILRDRKRNSTAVVERGIKQMNRALSSPLLSSCLRINSCSGVKPSAFAAILWRGKGTV